MKIYKENVKALFKMVEDNEKYNDGWKVGYDSALETLKTEINNTVVFLIADYELFVIIKYKGFNPIFETILKLIMRFKRYSLASSETNKQCNVRTLEFTNYS